ncbi:hypothetical protein J5J86_23965 [Aquabacter sp. L1I39]|uniref:hypothetical protein n=1 Tax=Aquabacter sp. L1I39 TaxID=2820278 RepID=UPI001ADB08C0|nr:hypothetical protein [Aquabacter sp. L1I39]QTL03740.1 hypothetical protein J5J86_23965 [Aquabacter sp. L1I39]
MDDDIIALMTTALATPDPGQRLDTGLAQQRAAALLAALRSAGYDVVRRDGAGEPQALLPEELNASNDG